MKKFCFFYPGLLLLCGVLPAWAETAATGRVETPAANATVSLSAADAAITPSAAAELSAVAATASQPAGDAAASLPAADAATPPPAREILSPSNAAAALPSAEEPRKSNGTAPFFPAPGANGSLRAGVPLAPNANGTNRSLEVSAALAEPTEFPPLVEPGTGWRSAEPGARAAFVGIHGGTAPMTLFRSSNGMVFAFTGKTGSDFSTILRGEAAAPASVAAEAAPPASETNSAVPEQNSAASTEPAPAADTAAAAKGAKGLVFAQGDLAGTARQVGGGFVPFGLTPQETPVIPSIVPASSGPRTTAAPSYKPLTLGSYQDILGKNAESPKPAGGKRGKPRKQ